MKMNKNEFIKELMKKLNYDEERCTLINDILEEHFLIGKNNKKNIINDLINKLGIEEKMANNIYNISSKIITTEIKNKLKHPFKNLDK